MSRATKRKWVNLVASLIVGATMQPLALLAGPVPGAALGPTVGTGVPTMAPTTGRSSRGHLALNGAIEALRRGDHDTAAALLQQAQALQNDLTPAERSELARLLAGNAQVQQVRRQAGEQLRLAEQALQQGRAAQAADLLRKVGANDAYLSAADKQRLQFLNQKLGMRPAMPPSAPGVNPFVVAHGKVEQARAELARANLDAAEALAHEAEQLRVTFAPREDSPQRVLADVDKARKDAKTLLQASRAALQRGELDRAEQYARAADQLGSAWTFPLWSDSPSKALQAIQAARAERQATAGRNAPPQGQPGARPAGPPGSTAAAVSRETADTEQARALIRQGRQALAAHDLIAARKYAEQARTLKANLHWSEDYPDKLLADVARAEAGGKGAPPAAPPGAVVIRNKEEALALLQQGREQLHKGNFEEAGKTAARLKAARNIHWGLFFEDTPDKLQADVDRVRAQRNKEKSVELMAEARRLFEKKDYDAASKLAYQARTLHGPYTIIEFGDRPDKLLAEIQTERQKNQRVKMPDPPMIAKGPPNLPPNQAGPPGGTGVPPVGQRPGALPATLTAQGNPQLTPRTTLPPTPPGAPDANVVTARQLLAEARVALRNGDTARARLMADRVRAMRVALNAPGDDSPDNIYREIDRLSRTPPNRPGPAPTQVAGGNVPPRPLPGAVAEGAAQAARTRAQQLLAEARTLQRQDRLIEARQKVVEAQQLGVRFAPGEDNPDLVYQQLAYGARVHINALIVRANDALNFTKCDPAGRCQEADRNLTQARQVAAAFGLDVQPIERATHQVDQLRGSVGLALAGGPPRPGGMLPPAGIENAGKEPVGAGLRAGPAGSPTPQVARGRELLDKARLELRNGEMASARRLAEEACNPGYGVRDEALMVLRSIGTEEMNQRFLRANRSFEAVQQAYNHGDYAHASALLAAIDTNLLNERHRARLREMFMTPEMKPAAQGQFALAAGQEPQQPRDRTSPPKMNPQLLTPPIGGTGLPGRGAADAGHARATDAGDPGLLARTQALREVAFQKLRSEGMTVQSNAAEKFRTGQTDAALEMLQDYLSQLDQKQLDPGQLTLLRRPIDSRLQQFRLMKAQADFANQSNREHVKAHDMINRNARAEQLKQKNVADLMKQFNDLFRQGKYEEAEALASRAHEIDPDNGAAQAGINMARLQRNRREYQSIKDGKGIMFLEGANDAEREGDATPIRTGISFEPDEERRARIQKRTGKLGELHMPRHSSEERKIESKLNEVATISCSNQPLKQVIEDLRVMKDVNIFIDEAALREDGISPDHVLSIKLENIPLKSLLNVMLSNIHLTHIIEDDVLKITTESHARGKLKQVVYQVADLVIPVENFSQPTARELLGAQDNNRPLMGAPSPVTGPYTLNNGQPVGTPTGGSLSQAGSNFATESSSGSMEVNKRAPSQTNEEMLIKLLTSTVAPKSWSEMGGPGTIDYFPLTMSLVINQTPDIQDQIADLLAALRRLQDQEVAIEVRFITINENFFERIGVNFNLNIVNRNSTKFQPELVSGAFTQPGFINQFAPGNFLSGLTPAGTLTSDLNIPITNSTYAQAIPPFGGYPGIPGFGGLTLGLAFLSDIQVFLFMEAVQGDIRTNVMQAPKLTLFNGQTATLSVSDIQFFTTGVQVVPQLGQFTYFPQVQIFPLTTTLFIQAVISADRRFVRLSLQPSMRNLATPNVQLFPVVTPIFPLFDGTATGQPVVFTQFIQQPHITTVFVQTTVAVPDGGTVLMGGLKRLSEGRNEYGPPVIGKIPYLSRLFRNIGYGREAASLLIMVTPRIIIQEEEEEKQTGYIRPQRVVP